MMQVMPNSGILSDDRLDKLRGEALTASDAGLPEAVVYYLRAIESAYLGLKQQQKMAALNEITWKLAQ